jgi:UDP-N-acetylglucosamine 4-epimerase
VNVTGFLNMLIAAREAKIKRFIYASSSSIYGDSTLSPKVEEHIGSPLSPYAASKYANELYAAAFSNSYGLNCIGLRYFNVFGERQDSDGDYAAVIPTFIKKLFLHESPVINGNGEQTRDFTYVKDVVRINLLALSAQKPESLNTVYNVACGNQTSLNELVVYLKNCLTSYDPGVAEIEAIYGPNRVGDVLQSLAGIRKAEKRLGYHPQYDVQQGLAATVRWFWMDQDSK